MAGLATGLPAAAWGGVALCCAKSGIAVRTIARLNIWRRDAMRQGQGKGTISLDTPYALVRQVSAVEGFPATAFGSTRVSIEGMRRGRGPPSISVDCGMRIFGYRSRFPKRREDALSPLVLAFRCAADEPSDDGVERSEPVADCALFAAGAELDLFSGRSVRGDSVVSWRSRTAPIRSGANAWRARERLRASLC